MGAWIELGGFLLVVIGTLTLGAYLVETIDSRLGSSEDRAIRLFTTPLYRTALRLCQQPIATEHPDRLNHYLAPALFLALAALGLALVPWSAGFQPVALPTTLVLWGAVEVLATVVIFLYGWAANAHFPLLAGYRYVSLGLSYMLISMFVLIAVALPAESLALGKVVESQTGVWNLIRQPLGLPLFLIVGLGLTFWGPLNFAQAGDLAGGVVADSSGPAWLAWAVARRAMLVCFSFIAASAFLGGWQGPLLPGPLWLVIKAGGVLLILLLLGQRLARISPDRFLTLAWVVLLPLSFLDLVWAGVLAL